MNETLNKAQYISLATFRKNGTAVQTPVWFAPGDNCFYAFSNGEAGKVKRLRNSSKAKIAHCSVSGSILGEWIEVDAHIIESKAQISAADLALIKKYGWQVRLLNFFSRLSGKMKERAYIAIQTPD